MIKSNPAYLAFDLGASSGRAILGQMDDLGKLVLTEVHRFSNAPQEEDGHFYWDFGSIVINLKQGFKKAYAVSQNIVTFSIDTWGVDYVFFRDGKPIRKPFCYRDPRNEKARETHQQIIPRNTFYARNGIQPLVFNTAYQLLSHQNEFPEDFENSFMLFMPDALHYVLTGDVTTEATIASTGAMLSLEKHDWDHESREEIGIPWQILTSLVGPISGAYCLSESICTELGVPPIPAVKCCSHDTACAVLAIPHTDNGNILYISLGTWALLGTEQIHPITSVDALEAGYTNEWGVDSTIRFLVNIVGTWLLQETRHTWNDAGNPITFAEMEQMAKGVPANRYLIDPDAPEFLAPGDMPMRIRNYCKRTGQGDSMSDAELVRCIYDSLAVCIAHHIQALERLKGVSYDKLNILGGGTKDSLLMQLLADASGKIVVAGPIEATAIGNILAQMLCCGALRNVQEARKLTADSFEVVIYTPRV